MPDRPDLRSVESRRRALEKRQELQDQRAGDSDDSPGRLGKLKQRAQKALKKRNAKRRTKERRKEIEAAREKRRDDTSVAERIFGEDTAEELREYAGSLGVEESDIDLERQLGMDFDGDGQTLGEELGVTVDDSGRQDRLQRDLDGLGPIGQQQATQTTQRRQRPRDPVDEDLAALGDAGRQDRRGGR